MLPDRQKWLVLALAEAQGPLTPVKLQKSLFLIGQAVPDASAGDFYEFVPYNYGPYDRRVTRDAEELANAGIIKKSNSTWGNFYEFEATDTTHVLAERYRQGMDDAHVQEVKRIVNWVRSQSFSGLLRAIYARWPEFRVNSIFRD